MEIWDDIICKEFDPKFVKTMRQEELEYVKKMGVYKKVFAQETMRVARKKPKRVRWIDVNKQTEFDPKYIYIYIS